VTDRSGLARLRLARAKCPPGPWLPHPDQTAALQPCVTPSNGLGSSNPAWRDHNRRDYRAGNEPGNLDPPAWREPIGGWSGPEVVPSLPAVAFTPQQRRLGRGGDSLRLYRSPRSRDRFGTRIGNAGAAPSTPSCLQLSARAASCGSSGELDSTAGPTPCPQAGFAVVAREGRARFGRKTSRCIEAGMVSRRRRSWFAYAPPSVTRSEAARDASDRRVDRVECVRRSRASGRGRGQLPDLRCSGGSALSRRRSGIRGSR
jgi:hypothetical protein